MGIQNVAMSDREGQMSHV